MGRSFLYLCLFSQGSFFYTRCHFFAHHCSWRHETNVDLQSILAHILAQTNCVSNHYILYRRACNDRQSYLICCHPNSLSLIHCSAATKRRVQRKLDRLHQRSVLLLLCGLYAVLQLGGQVERHSHRRVLLDHDEQQLCFDVRIVL